MKDATSRRWRSAIPRYAVEPVAMLDGGNNVVATFVYGSASHVPELMIAGGVTYRYVTDHLGSVRMVVNAATGGVVQRVDYDEFGVVTTDSNPGWQPFGFAGGVCDEDTGLVRFGARDYDAVTGRWTARDPILFGGGDSNLFAYVGGDPINFIDPSGLAAVGDIIFFTDRPLSLGDYSSHVGIVTAVDESGAPVRAFAAWQAAGMRYTEGAISSITSLRVVGTGSLGDLHTNLQTVLDIWTNRDVAPDWDGSRGNVCIDLITRDEGYGGRRLRNAMRADFRRNASGYVGSATASEFYRRARNLQIFLMHTGAYSDL